MERWFCSDWHLLHENIIKYQNRPFSNAHEMTEALITYHNMYVKPEDHYTTLGDVTMLRGGKVQQDEFRRLIKRFNGHGRIFLGNHDHFPTSLYVECFEKVYATWRSQENILWSHIPIHPQSMGSAIANCHGHIHANPSYDPVERYNEKTGETKYIPYINLSVEVTGYRPIHLDEVMQRIRDQAKPKAWQDSRSNKWAYGSGPGTLAGNDDL